ncbi:hypothetical protein [Glaciibacter superstes]|uniref:hypothetical protein n=1 Tax=Glaciibacter superstes TaxID=501023 RepID=UPI0003B5B708|nr:hypothetical protein [Glaciibacter superstes]
MPEPTTDPARSTRAERRPAGRRPLRQRRVLVSLAALAAVLIVGSVTVQAFRAAAQSEYTSAQSALSEQQENAAGPLDTAHDALDEAQDAFDDSKGKVLDEDPRESLATAIDDATDRIRSVDRELAASEDAIARAPDDGFFSPGIALRQGATELAAFRLDAAQDLADVPESLAGPVKAVTDAVAAWQAEQDRILASRYTNNVWAAGWIPELDACQGSVDLSANYGLAAIAEHWSCGGKDFPDDAGTIITLTGVRAGTYRVEGIVAMLNQNTATTADLPTGYDLLYQTCQDGQSSTMSMTALTKIG